MVGLVSVMLVVVNSVVLIVVVVKVCYVCVVISMNGNMMVSCGLIVSSLISMFVRIGCLLSRCSVSVVRLVVRMLFWLNSVDMYIVEYVMMMSVVVCGMGRCVCSFDNWEMVSV